MAHANTVQSAAELEMEAMKESYEGQLENGDRQSERWLEKSERQLERIERSHRNKLAWMECRARIRSATMKQSSDMGRQ